MAEMAFTFVDGVYVLVHTEKPPNDAEWDGYLTDIQGRKIPLEEMRTLVFTRGGGPTAAQRGKVNDMLGGRSSRAAIVSSAAMVRGVVTALGWFNKQIKSFPEDGVDDAMRHLELTPAQAASCSRELARLRGSFFDAKTG